MKQRQEAYTGRGLPMIFQDDTDTYEDFESLALRWRGERFGSVGIVQKQFTHFETSLPLRSGQTLEGFTIAYETYGKLNEDKSNAVLICHALSGDSHAAGFYTGEKGEKPGWWDHSIGSGKMFDTDKLFVICSNVIGGCQGSSGPSSLASDGKPYGMRFPFVTISDMVNAQRHLIDYLGIDKLFSVAGGSMGGMQALQWAVDYPERVGSVLFLASTPRSSTQNIAFNEIGRQAIYADPNWNKGDYYGGIVPTAGLSVARMVGHITYMSEKSLDEKFGRRTQKGTELSYNFDTDFAVEAYLQHQGEKFVERFDPNSYLYITKALDYYDVADGYNSMNEALKHTQCPFLVLTISSDWLYTAAQGMELVNVLRDLQRDVEYRHVEASFGHDSFLVEVETMTTIVGGYIDRLLRKQKVNVQPPPQPSPASEGG